jgi:hypothetical protein
VNWAVNCRTFLLPDCFLQKHKEWVRRRAAIPKRYKKSQKAPVFSFIARNAGKRQPKKNGFVNLKK